MNNIQKTFTKLLIILSIFVFSGLQTAYAENYPELCSVLNRTLKVGDTGTDVRRLQVVMGQEGIAYLSATGYYGNATSLAVKTFQVRNGIYPAGKVGPQTLRFMKNLWCNGEGNNGTNIDNTYIPINTNNPELPPQGWNNGGNNWNNGTVPEVSVQPVYSSANNITISWNTRAVNSCSIQQDNNNFQNVQGIGQQIFTLYGESRFSLKCMGFNGREYSKTIVVRPNQSISSLPIVNVSINPSSIIIGQQATLYWTSNNTAYCTSNVPGNTSNLPISGSIPVTITTGRQSYTFTCYNQMGQYVSQNITANNSQIAVPTINNFTYSNNLLAWGTSNVNSCILSGGNLNNMSVQTNGNYSVTNIPTTNTTWTLTCNGNNNQSVTRQVNFNGTNTNTNLSLISNVNGLVNVLIGTPNTGISCVQAINASIVWGDGQTQQFTSCGNTLSHQYINSGTYNIVVNNLSGMQTGSLQVVTNNTANSNITVNISANPNPVAGGQLTNLSWYSSNASYCNIVGGNTNLSNQPANGSYAVSPAIGTNYQITCYGNNGQHASNFVYVTINGGSSNSGITLLSNSNRNVSVRIGNVPTGEYQCAQVINARINWGDGQTQEFTDSCGPTLTHYYSASGTKIITVTDLNGNNFRSLQVNVN